MRGIKLKRSLLCFAVVFCIIFSLCGCEKNNAEDKETTAETTLQTLHYSEEELDAMAENMPEIVFAMSHHYDNTNILGFYIMNTGEMKMFDFRSIAPDEIFEFPDVYDRLEEATCTELNFGGEMYSADITETDMAVVSEDELSEYYQKMLLITKEPEYKSLVEVDMIYGHYRYYGIKNNSSGEQELILLGGWGSDYEFTCDDLYWDNVYNWISRKFRRGFTYFH